MTTGQLYVISAPSGAGKTSLIKALRGRRPEIALSVSHTTRPPRPGERDGVHYHFVTVERFRQMIDQGDFVEYAEVFGNFYGTSVQAIEDVLAGGADLILEIDWQGADQVRAKFPDAVSVFILPPNTVELRKRLEGRGQDAPEVIERRLAEAVTEMRACGRYDYLVFNDDFESAVDELDCIFTGQRLRTERQRLAQRDRLADLLGSAAAT